MILKLFKIYKIYKVESDAYPSRKGFKGKFSWRKASENLDKNFWEWMELETRLKNFLK